MQITKINYKGWSNSYCLSNGLVELVVTTDVGPRVIFFGFADEGNEFKEYPDQIGKTGGNDWRIYGGHRLWHAPESIPRTYYPDNFPVCLEEHPGFVRLIQPVETTTGIQKEIDIALDTNAAHARMTHRLRNLNLWDVKLAPWAMSVMQAIVLGHIRSLEEARAIVRGSFTPQIYEPRRQFPWDDTYARFLEVMENP